VKRVLISLADRSASNYVRAIFSEGFSDIELKGLTDERLKGLIRSIGDYREISSVGLVESLFRIPSFLRLYRRLVEELGRTDVLILCDAPALNLRLLKEARKRGVKRIIYFISPQVWAWKPQRARLIGELVDHLVVILPFEKEIYRDYPVKVHYLGHPLVDLARPPGKLKSRGKLLSLLPGSRRGEVKRHVGLLRPVARELRREYRLLSPTFPEFEDELRRDLGVETLSYEGAAYDCFSLSVASLVASGTASLEAGLLGNPHLVFYRVNPITYAIGKRLVKVPFVSLVNLLLGREVVPEVIQKSPDELLRTFYGLLERRDSISENLEELREILGGSGVVPRLRDLFRELIYY